MRLQEWVAEEKGYYKDEGLDYEFVPSTGFSQMSVKSATELPKDQIKGAYQTIEAGRTCDISSACHWTINMAAAAGHGRLWAGAYSVLPCAMMVPPDSKIKTANDLANVPITVGYQSGSHYTTIQALEPIIKREEIKLHFGGMIFQRLELLIDREIPVATLFGGMMYFAEQLGFRKIVDTTFMVGHLVSGDANTEDLERYFKALRLAQQDIDMEPEIYKHYFLKELPERYHGMVDIRAFGPGERLVFEPYPREIFERTRKWIESWNLFPSDQTGNAGYEASVI